MPPRFEPQRFPTLRAALLLLTALLAGCGSSTPVTTTQTSSYLNITGNWNFGVLFQGSQGTGTNTIFGFTAGLTSSGSTVTGILRTYGSQTCILGTTDLTATGTLDSSGNLALTFPIAGGVGSIAMNVSPSVAQPSGTFVNGTYQIVGGACAHALNPLAGNEVPNLTGTYIGTLTQVLSGPAISTVTVALIQSNTPNSDGQFPLSGTVTSTGACTSSLTFTQGVVFGFSVSSYPSTGAAAPPASFGASAVPSTKQNLATAFIYELPGCGATFYDGGPLTLQ